MADGAPELSAQAAAHIANPAHAKYVSVASLWEIAIKVSIRKLTLRRPLDEMIAALRATGLVAILPIADAHVVKVSTLPLHHRDPFDRLLAAQCGDKAAAALRARQPGHPSSRAGRHTFR